MNDESGDCEALEIGVDADVDDVEESAWEDVEARLVRTEADAGGTDDAEEGSLIGARKAVFVDFINSSRRLTS